MPLIVKHLQKKYGVQYEGNDPYIAGPLRHCSWETSEVDKPFIYLMNRTYHQCHFSCIGH